VVDDDSGGVLTVEELVEVTPEKLADRRTIVYRPVHEGEGRIQDQEVKGKPLEPVR
jgi:hypothetical protein